MVCTSPWTASRLSLRQNGKKSGIPVKCDFVDSYGGECGFIAKSVQGMRCHRFYKHGLYGDMSWLAVCNMCPICEQVFKSRRVCLHHIKTINTNGFCSKRCTNPLGMFGNSLIPPAQLCCRLCEAEFDSLGTLFEHLVLHCADFRRVHCQGEEEAGQEEG